MTRSGGGTSRRFVVDAMLGRVARWLLILGHDALYDPRLDDDRLATLAATRTLLSRDRALMTRAPGLLVAGNDPLEQLRQIVAAYDLDGERFLSRCTCCNVALVASADWCRVPENARRQATTLHACPACGRLYWDGSHVDAMRRRLAALLPRFETLA